MCKSLAARPVARARQTWLARYPFLRSAVWPVSHTARRKCSCKVLSSTDRWCCAGLRRAAPRCARLPVLSLAVSPCCLGTVTARHERGFLRAWPPTGVSARGARFKPGAASRPSSGGGVRAVYGWCTGGVRVVGPRQGVQDMSGLQPWARASLLCRLRPPEQANSRPRRAQVCASSAHTRRGQKTAKLSSGGQGPAARARYATLTPPCAALAPGASACVPGCRRKLQSAPVSVTGSFYPEACNRDVWVR